MSLKVFDLQCGQGHVFEGWFSSFENYELQKTQGLVTCPVCSNADIIKKLSAPRLNISRAKEPAGNAAASAPAGNAVAAPSGKQLAQLQAEAIRHIRHIIRNTDDVGARFSQEARRMHEGEVEERAIRGTATAQERESLAEDGIVVMPIPDFLDDERLQ